MRRILSIDWDYFINLDVEQRASLMPDGCTEDLAQHLKWVIWASRYMNKKLAEIGTRGYQLSKLQRFIKNHRRVPLYVNESHKSIVEVAEMFNDGELEIVNIDYHHDLFQFKDKVHCGNWASYLINKGVLKSLTWMYCKESDTAFRLERPYYCSVDCYKGMEHLQGEFDAIFLCRSDMWSPPHLDAQFNKFCGVLLDNHIPTVIEGSACVDRYEWIKMLSNQMREDNGLCVK